MPAVADVSPPTKAHMEKRSTKAKFGAKLVATQMGVGSGNLRRRRKRRLTRIAALLAAAAITFSGPSPAFAVQYLEWDWAVKSGAPPWNAPCDEHYYVNAAGGLDAYVCFVAYGDYFYVLDKKADWKSAAAYWVMMDGSRTGACINNHGAGTWAKCNKNFVEGKVISLRAGTYDTNHRTIDDDGSSIYVTS